MSVPGADKAETLAQASIDAVFVREYEKRARQILGSRSVA
jgi:hypothetical protein